MAATVRERILAAVMAAVEGIDGVGLVVDAGRRDQVAVAMGEVLAGGEYAIEMAALDDELLIEASTTLHDAFAFEVLLVVHLPDGLADEGSEPLQPYQVAARVHAAVVRLYAGLDDAAGTWGGEALHTANLGGGGVGISELGTVCTASVFRVSYRHLRTNPEVVG